MRIVRHTAKTQNTDRCATHCGIITAIMFHEQYNCQHWWSNKHPDIFSISTHIEPTLIFGLKAIMVGQTKSRSAKSANGRNISVQARPRRIVKRKLNRDEYELDSPPKTNKPESNTLVATCDSMNESIEIVQSSNSAVKNTRKNTKRKINSDEREMDANFTSTKTKVPERIELDGTSDSMNESVEIVQTSKINMGNIEIYMESIELYNLFFIKRNAKSASNVRFTACEEKKSLHSKTKNATR